MVDDQHLHWSLSALQLEPELMNEGGLGLRVRVVVWRPRRRHQGCPPLQAEVPQSGKIGAINDRRLHVLDEYPREFFRGLAAGVDATSRTAAVPGDRGRGRVVAALGFTGRKWLDSRGTQSWLFVSYEQVARHLPRDEVVSQVEARDEDLLQHLPLCLAALFVGHCLQGGVSIFAGSGLDGIDGPRQAGEALYLERAQVESLPDEVEPAEVHDSKVRVVRIRVVTHAVASIRVGLRLANADDLEVQGRADGRLRVACVAGGEDKKKQ